MLLASVGVGSWGPVPEVKKALAALMKASKCSLTPPMEPRSMVPRHANQGTKISEALGRKKLTF